MFTLGLKLVNTKNVTLPGTPIRLYLQKECEHRGVYDRSLTSMPGIVCFFYMFELIIFHFLII